MDTRMEFTALENGRFQWKLWAEGKLVESIVGRPEDLDRYLRSAALLLLPFGSEAAISPRWDIIPGLNVPIDERLFDAVIGYCRRNGIESPADLAREALAEKIGCPELAVE